MEPVEIPLVVQVGYPSIHSRAVHRFRFESIMECSAPKLAERVDQQHPSAKIHGQIHRNKRSQRLIDREIEHDPAKTVSIHPSRRASAWFMHLGFQNLGIAEPRNQRAFQTQPCSSQSQLCGYQHQQPEGVLKADGNVPTLPPGLFRRRPGPSDTLCTGKKW